MSEARPSVIRATASVLQRGRQMRQAEVLADKRTRAQGQVQHTRARLCPNSQLKGCRTTCVRGIDTAKW